MQISPVSPWTTSSGHAVARDLREPLEGPQVRGEANVHLLDAKLGVLCAVTNVAGRDDVDAGAVAAPLDRSDDGNRALLERGYAALHHEDEVPKLERVLNFVAVDFEDGLEYAEVDPRAEVLPLPAEHDDLRASILQCLHRLRKRSPHLQVLSFFSREEKNSQSNDYYS